MSTPLAQWFQDLPAFNGLLAAFVIPAGHAPVIRSWSDDLTPDGIAAAHQQIKDVVEVLETSRMPARKLRWIFGRTVIYFEHRRDGAGLCLITTHDPWTGDGDVVPTLIADFRAAG